MAAAAGFILSDNHVLSVVTHSTVHETVKRIKRQPLLSVYIARMAVTNLLYLLVRFSANHWLEAWHHFAEVNFFCLFIWFHSFDFITVAEA